MDLCVHSSIRLHGVALNLLGTGTTLPFYLFWFKAPSADPKRKAVGSGIDKDTFADSALSWNPDIMY
jgi:hypothetical protein